VGESWSNLMGDLTAGKCDVALGGDMADLLPRDDVAFKSYMDQWLHLAKAGGGDQRVVDGWLR
jgi:hypothetical protein